MRTLLNLKTGLAGAAMLLAVTVAVYVTAGLNGNAQAAQNCAGSARISAQIAPLIGGEVAALSVHKEPRELPAFALTDNDDVNVNPNFLTGRVSLVNLWATWCVPCREEMPALDGLQAALGGDAFQVVAINMDRGGPPKGKAFYEEFGLKSLDYYYDTTGRLIYALKAFGLPTTLLVGPDGCEIARMAGPAEWASDDAKAVIKAAVGGAS